MGFRGKGRKIWKILETGHNTKRISDSKMMSRSNEGMLFQWSGEERGRNIYVTGLGMLV